MKRKQATRSYPSTRKTSNMSITAIAPQKFRVSIGGETRMFKSATNAKAYVLGYLAAGTDWKNKG